MPTFKQHNIHSLRPRILTLCVWISQRQSFMASRHRNKSYKKCPHGRRVIYILRKYYLKKSCPFLQTCHLGRLQSELRRCRFGHGSSGARHVVITDCAGKKKCMRLGRPPMAERSYEGSRISVDLFINGNGGQSLMPDILILIFFSSYYTVRGTAHMCLSRCIALLLPSTVYFTAPLTPYVVHMYPIVNTCVLLVQSIISLHEKLYFSKIKLFYFE